MMATCTLSDLENTLQSLSFKTPIPQFPSSAPLDRPVDLIRIYLADLLHAIIECEQTAAYSSIGLSTDPNHGDLTVTMPRLVPGAKGARAAEVANDILTRFIPNPLFGLPFLDGISLRFFLKLGELPRIFIPYILERTSHYGLPHEKIAKKVLVEFSSPNISSDFQAKHLRSTILGSFISKLYASMGCTVTKINYLGDWGKDIALLGVGWEKFGSAEEFEKDPASHLLEVYHKIHEMFLPEQLESKKARDEAKKNGQDEAEVTAEIEGKGLFAERNAFFKRMEDGDAEALALAKKIRDVNIANYTKFYARLGLDFDEYSGESQVNHDIITEIEQILKDKGISEESGGACIINMKKLGAKSGTERVRDRTGSSTYFVRYLATVLERSRKHDFDKMIFVAADRSGLFGHMVKVFEAMDMAELAAKLEHVQFNDASHMAEKLGQGYQPQGILDQCETAVSEALQADEEKAKLLATPGIGGKSLGITALLAQELSTKRGTEHAFDVPAMASFKSGTGLDFQYQYAKLCAILREHPYSADTKDEELKTLDDEEHTSLLLTLGQYPELLQASYQSHEPSAIMSYLHTVVDKLSDCMEDEDEDEEGKEDDGGEDQEDMIEPSDKVSRAQSALYEVTRIVLENAMTLLGLDPVASTQPPRADTPLAA